MAPRARDAWLGRLVQVAFLAGLILVWYLATTRWGVNRLLLPNPVAVFHDLVEILRTGEYVDDLKITLGELAAAFAIAVTGGLTTGYLISRSPYLTKVFEPLFAGIYAIPIILFLPLFVLFFGLGPASKIAIGATISFFPITLNTIAGFGRRRSPLRHRGALHGGVGPPSVPLRAAAGGAAGDSHRPADGLHRRAVVDHRQRDAGFARRPRPPHRVARGVDGDGADVRLHRVRDRDRGGPQRRRLDPRSAGEMALKRAAPSPWAGLVGALARRPGLARLLVIVALLAVWEIAARWFVDPLFLSPPSKVIASLGALFETRGVPAALQITLFELAVAFVIAVAIGLVLGLAIGLQPFVRLSVFPIVLLLYGMPQITILPLFILYFGIGAASKIAFGVTHGVFPVVVTVVAGVQNLKPILVTSARSMGASRWQMFRHVIFPHMVPSFFAGMRLGMSGVLLGVLLAELYVSIAGIGYFTTLFTQNFQPAKLLGLVGTLAAMAIFLNALVRRAETHFGKWRTG